MATNPTTGLLILKSVGSVGKQHNHTTLSCKTIRSGIIIEVSLLAERPPHPSILFVHCPDPGDSAFDEKPLVLSMVDDFFLVRVVIASLGRFVSQDQEYDYFIYNPSRGILTELPHPHPLVFYPNQVGLLPRGDKYTIAALVSKVNPFMHELVFFNSEAGSWKSKMLRVDPLLREFPVRIPKNSSDLLRHKTSNVITLGGEYGTMGWVDLWRDVLLCDVLHPRPVLRPVPLPLPMKQINSNGGLGCRLGLPRPFRGIAYIEAKRCLEFVEIQLELPSDGDKTKLVGWSVKTFSNTKMTTLWADWHPDLEAEAKDIKIVSAECSEMISKLHSSHDDGAVAEPTLRDLFVFQPGLSIDDNQVVYLLTCGDRGGDNTWVLALDLKNKTLVDVVKFGTETLLFSPVAYCRGSLCLFKTASQGFYNKPRLAPSLISFDAVTGEA